DNVELRVARERRLPVIHRADLLAHLVRLKPNAVIVGGTHGKTTTTSMISAVLDHANIGATSIVGGILRRSGTNARWGTGDYLVAEADEHDGSFLRLHPTIAVVTNIDAEHLEFYGTIDKIRSAFIEFCNTVPFYGYSILCHDDANCRGILDELDSVSVTYGLEDGAGMRGTNLRITQCDRKKPKAAQLASLCTAIDVENNSDVLGPTGRLGTIEVNALGPDNARNALAACTVGLCLGMRFGAIAEGIRDFTGVQRRLQVVGEVGGVTVIEDYAHHPTEIRSTLAAVRQVEPGRVIVVFQPHLYSRTNYFSTEFAEALAGADLAL
ncbi:MAG: Mur ligase family protein, partial [Candidatus Hydrogenedentales bacterium]